MMSSAFSAGVAVMGAAALIVGGVARASEDPPDSMITGCYLKATGFVRVIDASAGKKCLKIEQTITWNQVGPSGPQGAPGVEGKSAYEVWLDQGNSGSVADFLASLQGGSGEPGSGLGSIEGLAGAACMLPTGRSGRIDVTVADDGAVLLRCGAPAAGGPVTINEFFGSILSGGLDGEFIELYNGGTGAVNLEGWQLVFRQANSTDDHVLFTFGAHSSIDGGQFLLVGNEQFPGPAFFRYSGAFIDSMLGGGLQLRDSQGRPVDSAGWGFRDPDNGFTEGSQVMTGPSHLSGSRCPDGQDSRVNDWVTILLKHQAQKHRSVFVLVG